MKVPAMAKIIWAVDVFEDTERHSHALFLLGVLSRGTQAKIQPVFLLSPGSSKIPKSTFAEYLEAFKTLAEKRLAELVSRADLPAMTSPVVLVNSDGSQRKDTELLINFAKENSADVIVTATHARRGLSRLLMGSFAENLLFRSTVPIMTVNPDTQVRENIRTILYPTNFNSRFRRPFEQVVELARSLDARLTLYYKEPVIESAFMSPEIHEYIQKEAVARMERAEQWRSYATALGVAVDLKLDNQPGYPAHSINNLAGERNFDLIAMATQVDPVSAYLMGSLTRQVVRQAPCPVWILRADEEKI